MQGDVIADERVDEPLPVIRRNGTDTSCERCRNPAAPRSKVESRFIPRKIRPRERLERLTRPFRDVPAVIVGIPADRHMNKGRRHGEIILSLEER